MKTKALGIAIILALVFTGVALAANAPSTPVSDGGITPYIIDGENPGGNRTCAEVGMAFFGEADYYELTTGKIDYNGGFGGSFDPIIVSTDGTYVSWQYAMHNGLAVIVKGTNDANVYVYDGTYTEDSGLASPPAGSGMPGGLSNLTVCWNPGDEELTVSKTVVTSYTRTHLWDIDKKVETENEYTHDGYPKVWLYIDGNGAETATWTVDVTYEGYEDSAWNVSGEITIENTGTLEAVITSVDDVLGGAPIVVDCGVIFPYTFPVGETLTCTYDEDGYVEGYNEVTVTTERAVYGPVSEPIVWGAPTTEINKTVNVKDISDLFGEVDLGTVTAPNDGQFTYTKDFAWEDYGEEDCGDYIYENTAMIVETGQYDSATLLVNVQCYIYETAYAKGESAICFIPTFSQWGWTNPIWPGEYTWDLWAGAGQCDTSKGTLVGSVTVIYGVDGYVTVTYNVDSPYLLDETHIYADTTMFPMVKIGKKLVATVAPGQYYNASPFNGSQVYVIAHAVVGIPDPNFGP